MKNLCLCGLLLLATQGVLAAEPLDSLTVASANIKARMQSARPDIPILGIKPAAVEGLFEVSLPGGQTLTFTADGRYFFTGDAFEVTTAGLVNLSEATRTTARKEMLDQMDEDDMVVFSPPRERVKATVTVFTDIDCGYCRKLHKEVPDLNRLGIAVRYLAYPRAGPDSESAEKLVSAWCADDPRTALTKAKLGESIDEATCDNPVAAQYEMGGLMGVTGTPALIFEDGRLAPGYLPAEKLAVQLGVL